jgi:fructose-1,6-bisphosphatase I
MNTTPTVELTEALALNLSGLPADAAQALSETLLTIAQACAGISEVAAQGALAGAHGLASSSNSQGEDQTKLDVMADEVLSAAA